MMDEYESAENKFTYILRVVIFPIVIIVGIILNLLSFFVMRRVQGSTTSYYMAVLGLVDSGVLIIGGISAWSHSFTSNLSFTMASNLSCKLIPFLTYTFLDLSVCIIVVMTADRFYAVWRPLQANKMVKKKNFRLNLLISILVCASINFHFLWTHQVQKHKILSVHNQAPSSPAANSQSSMFSTTTLTTLTTLSFNSDDGFDEASAYSKAQETQKYYEDSHEFACLDTEWNSFYEKYWVYIDAAIYSFLPSILLTIFNVSIIRYLFKAADESLKLKEYQNSGYGGHYHTRSSYGYGSLRSSIRSNRHGSSFSGAHGLASSPVIVTNLGSPTHASASTTLATIADMSSHSHMTNLTKMTELDHTSIRHLNSGSRSASHFVNKYGSHLTLNELQIPAHFPRRKRGSQNADNHHLHLMDSQLEPSGSITSILSQQAIRVPIAYKRFNVRLTIMLVTLNITFCVFSMPIVILQILFYTIVPALGGTPSANLPGMMTQTPSAYGSNVQAPATAHSIFNEIHFNESLWYGPNYNHSLFTSTLKAMATTSSKTTTAHEEQLSIVMDIPIDDEVLAKMDILKALAELLQYLNHSTNFFLYSFSGKTFRNQTKEFLRTYFVKICSLFSVVKNGLSNRYKTIRKRNSSTAHTNLTSTRYSNKNEDLLMSL